MDQSITPNSSLKIGLVLSGGGVRAVSHLGVMQALIDRGIEFSHISATSAGAIGAAFYAEGYAPKEILKIIRETNFFTMLRPAISSTGFLSILNAQSFFQQHIPHNSFSKLKIPITISSVDLSEGKLVRFTAGELDKCILASCCIPGIFKPIMIDGHMFVDGGVLSNLPADPLVGVCDFIIGSSCNHLNPVSEIHSFGELVDRASMLAIKTSLDAQKALCNVIIEPKGMGRYGLFATPDAEEIYMLGYEEGLKTIDKNVALKSILPGSK